MRNMRGIIYSLPDQIVESIKLFDCLWSVFPHKEHFKKFKRVIICGMGGSGISGDITSQLYPGIEVLVNKDYKVPEYLDKTALSILVSYSGNTEETLSNYKILKKKGLFIVVISSNGKLMRQDALLKIKIPGGLPPRGALGYLFTPIPLLLYRAGLLKNNPAKELLSLALFLKSHIKDIEKRAKTLTRIIKDKLPIIYANSGLFGVVAKRWQCQFNENSKILCHTNIIPEMNHNEIVGIGRPEQLNNEMVAIFLNDPGALNRNALRVRIVKEIIKKEAGGLRCVDINPRGRNPLEYAFWTIMLGDFISYYLALGSNIDPIPVKRIDYLKNRLSKSI
uniref:Bifunctional phosphoglucose/phosphomannose isomerase n=1 Tax=candidate division WOR-3 bacterium TaxID=2052148 RepID=A0A7V3RG21_UNCW3